MNLKPEPSQLEECRMLKENILDLKGTVWRLKCKLAQEEITYKRELSSKTDAVRHLRRKLVSCKDEHRNIVKLLCQTLHKKRLYDENTAHEKLKAIDTIVEKLMELNFELLTLRGSHS